MKEFRQYIMSNSFIINIYGMAEELSKTRLGRYAALRHKKRRDAERLFLVEGEKCIRELAGAYEPEALIATRQWLDTHTYLANNLGQILVADSKKMQRLSSLATAPEVIAVMKMPSSPQTSSPLPRGLYLAIDGVQDPGNLGTIIRTADWYGIDTVFASHDTVDLYNSKTVQATMGSMSRVKVTYTDLPTLFAANPSLPVYGTLLDGNNIYGQELSECGFIVMGNEGNGLSDAVRRKVTHRLLLPPYGNGPHAESLNVGIATALVVAEFRRRTAIHSDYGKGKV